MYYFLANYITYDEGKAQTNYCILRSTDMGTAVQELESYDDVNKVTIEYLTDSPVCRLTDENTIKQIKEDNEF